MKKAGVCVNAAKEKGGREYMREREREVKKKRVEATDGKKEKAKN